MGCTFGPAPQPTPDPTPDPTPVPVPTPPEPEPTPEPTPTPTPSPSPVSLDAGMLGFYYFVDDCPDARLNVPPGMLSAGNAVFLSFITDDQWEESAMTNKLSEVAQKIKQMKPDMYVAYSVGGQVGSMSQSLFDYISGTDEDTIVSTILGWQHVDGIDWDLEPPSGGAAAGYGKLEMAQKLNSISQKVKAGGKHVTMAGFGAWVWDGTMATLNGELIISGAMEKYGVMVYPPSQSSADDVVSYMKAWKGGAKAGPSEVQGHGAEPERLAGGISGPAKVSEAVSIATKYHSAGATSAIVWMVKPDQCSDMTGWTATNSELPQWTAVLAALKGESATMV